MGQYHFLINLDKKQVIHPHQIGNGLKLTEQIGWDYSTATVLVMLLAASSREGGRGGGDFNANHPLIGSWAGDRITFLGNYATANDVPSFDAPLVYQQCKAACCPEKPDKPEDWEEWTNISAQVQDMMRAEFHIRYAGEGWLDIVDSRSKSVQPALAPDLVITSAKPLK